VNLISNDVNRFDISFLYIPFLWIGPLETIVTIYFLWQEVGVSSILGVTTLFIFIPLQSELYNTNIITLVNGQRLLTVMFDDLVWLGLKTSEIRSQTAERTDKRVQLMYEIISGLQVIKMYTWEPFFTNLTNCART